MEIISVNHYYHGQSLCNIVSEHPHPKIVSYPILPSQKTTLSIIPYYFTILPTSQLLFLLLINLNIIFCSFFFFFFFYCFSLSLPLPLPLPLSLPQLAPAKPIKTPPLTSHLSHQRPANNHHHNHHANLQTH